MCTELTSRQLNDYHRDGFVAGIRVFDTDAVGAIRAEIERLEHDQPKVEGGHDLNRYFRVNGHLVIPLLADLARTPLNCSSRSPDQTRACPGIKT